MGTRKNIENQLARFGFRSTFMIFMLVILFNWADKNLFSPKLNAILADFGFGIDESTPLGLIATLTMITTGIGTTVFGILADVKKRKWITVFSGYLYGTLTLLTFFTPHGIAGYWYLFFMRILGGFGLGAIVPSIYSMIGDSAPPDKRAKAFGKFTVATALGQMVGMILASISTNWRDGYLIVGLFELTLTTCMVFIQEPKRGFSEVELQVKILEGAEYNYRFKKEDVKMLWANKTNRWIILNFIDTIPGSLIAFMIFKYLDDYHNIKAENVTIIIGLGFFGGILGALLFGYLGDKWYNKNKKSRAYLALFCNLMPVTTYLLIFSPTFTGFTVPDGATLGEMIQYPQIQFLIFIVVITLFINQGTGPNWYSSVLDINLPEHRATMISVASFADLIGQAIGPLIGTLINDNLSGRAAMASIAIFWILNGLFWIPVIKNIITDINKNKNILEERAKMLKS